jgi:hypothetical protein
MSQTFHFYFFAQKYSMLMFLFSFLFYLFSIYNFYSHEILPKINGDSELPIEEIEEMFGKICEENFGKTVGKLWENRRKTVVIMLHGISARNACYLALSIDYLFYLPKKYSRLYFSISTIFTKIY